jgi:hypothetical protein
VKLDHTRMLCRVEAPSKSLDNFRLPETTLVQAGRSVSWAFRKSINDDTRRARLEKRIKEKNGWTELEFNQIDFPNYGKLQKKRTVPLRVRSSKVMNGTLPTLVRLKEMFPEKYEVTTCPCCGNREETNDHLWACKSTELEPVVKEELLALEEKMVKYKTPRPIWKAMRHGIKNWITCQTGNGTEIEWDGDSIIEPDTADELTMALMEAFASQSAIGWKFLFRGALSKKWAKAFAYNYKGDNPVRAGQWTRMVIKGFWNITESVWKARNGKFHGKDPVENRAKVKENLRPEIVKGFETPVASLHRTHRRLLTKHTLEGILKSSYATQVAWLYSIKKARIAAGRIARG